MTQRLQAIDLEGRLLPPNEVVADRFKVGRRIGEGPFGQLFEAQDQLIESEVAIKVFFGELMGNPREEERFLKVTRRARALTQKNVVRLHDSGLHGDLPWVSMQYLDGLNLRKVARLRQQRGEGFSLREVEPIISQLTLALQHIGRDFPHGNVKPENVVVLPKVVKLTDSFITAALPSEIVARRLGDCGFVAPEIRDGDDFDRRADVYSLGRLIGFLVFGEDYEPGSEPDAPGSLSAVDALCRKASATSAQERYDSVEALCEDFTSVVDTGMLLEQGPSVVMPADAIPASPTEKTQVVQREDLPTEDEAEAKPIALEEDVEEDVDVEQEAAADEASPDPHPLEVETPEDIGMPREEDLDTEEFDRDLHAPELGDMLPTNEVDRDIIKEASKEVEEAASEQQDGAEEAAQQPANEPQTDDSAPVPSPSPQKSENRKAPASTPATTSNDDSGAKQGLIAISVVALLLVVGGIFVFTAGDEGGEPAPVGVEEDGQVVDMMVEAYREAIGAAQREAVEEYQRAMERRHRVVGEAQALVWPAQEEALEASAARAEELEEEESAQEATGAAAGPAGGAPAQPAAAECPSGMVQIRVGGEVRCIDQYQYPGRGRVPQTNVSWFDANSLCGQRDRRLCSLDEWRAACGSTYPYGASYDADRCNTADADGFPRDVAETGSFAGCRSPSGAYDMSGNVFEWVEDEVVVGGDYDSRADTATCQYTSGMSRTASRANVGFRCCVTPE